MHASIQYGSIFGVEDLVSFVVGLIIFISIISMIEAGVMVLLQWDKFWQSLRVSLQMNVSSTIFGMGGGILISGMMFDKFSIWLATAFAFLLSVLIEGGILMLTKRGTPLLNWVVSLIANATSYSLLILPISWIN